MEFPTYFKSIGIDVDGVLNSLMYDWHLAYNNMSGDTLSFEKFATSNLPDVVKPAWREAVFELLGAPSLYRNSAVVDGARDGIQKLIAAGFDVYIISAFFPYLDGCREKTLWLSKNFPEINLRERLIFTKAKHLVNVRFLVDDCYSNIKRFNDYRYQHSHPDVCKDLGGIWFKQLWSKTNEVVDPDTVTICSTWNDVTQYLLTRIQNENRVDIRYTLWF